MGGGVFFLSDEKLKIKIAPMFQQKKKENKTYCVVVGTNFSQFFSINLVTHPFTTISGLQ